MGESQSRQKSYIRLKEKSQSERIGVEIVCFTQTKGGFLVQKVDS